MGLPCPTLYSRAERNLTGKHEDEQRNNKQRQAKSSIPANRFSFHESLSSHGIDDPSTLVDGVK
jgi:hypothetical protein